MMDTDDVEKSEGALSCVKSSGSMSTDSTEEHEKTGTDECGKDTRMGTDGSKVDSSGGVKTKVTSGVREAVQHEGFVVLSNLTSTGTLQVFSVASASSFNLGYTPPPN